MNILQAFAYLKTLFILLMTKKSYVVLTFITSLFLTSIINVLESIVDFKTDNEILNAILGEIITKHNIIEIFLFTILILFSYLIIIADFISGVNASRVLGNKIESSKIQYTTAKLFGVFIYAVLSFGILIIFSTSHLVLLITLGPIVLSTLREYVSIGENIEKAYGQKPHIFTIVDKIFETLEKTFFNRINKKLNNK